MIDVCPVYQEPIGNGPTVPVFPVSLERDVLAEHSLRRGLLRCLTVGLTLLRAVNPVEADSFSAGVVQDVDRVAVEDSNNLTGEILERDGGTEEKKQKSETEDAPRCPSRTGMIRRHREPPRTQAVTRIWLPYQLTDTFPHSPALAPTTRLRGCTLKRSAALGAGCLHVSPCIDG